ncbi:MAG: glycosyl transferase [Helicobacter sp.]|nr:glycosyl transferase [Helicobacter sp.]
MPKYSLGIFLAATKDSAFAVGTMMINIKDKMGGGFDVFYIAHDGFSSKNKEAIEEITHPLPVKFLSFTREEFINKLKAKNPKMQLNNHFLGRWTHMAYAMFEPLLLLEECECIIYLDFDILLLCSLAHLRDFRDCEFAAHKGRTRLSQTLPKYKGEFQNERVWRSGIVVYNDIIPNPQECYDFIYHFSSQHPLNINDQGAMSLLFLEKNFRIQNLGYEYTGSTFWRKSRGYYIIHAWGNNGRFWNNALVNRIWREWGEYYKQWLEFGGEAYKGGFIAKANYAIERIRFHLAYKLGFAICECPPSFLAYLKLPCKLRQIALIHKQEQKQYFQDIQAKPYLKLPPLETYEDYKEALKEKQSIPYRLGFALIKAHKNRFKGGYFRFFKEARKLQKEGREN